MTKPFAIISFAIREADGIEKLSDFLISLDRNGISPKNQIVIALKESSETFHNQVMKLIGMSKKLQHQIKIVYVPPGGFDIGSHYHVAIQNKCEVLILMSASSTPNTKNWDSLLTGKFEDADTGIVGSMFSKESIKTSYLEMLDIQLKIRLHIKLSKNEKLLAKIRGLTKDQKSFLITPNFITRSFLRLLRRWVVYVNIGKEPFSFLDSFPAFPNPHLRTTGFAIRRELLLSVIDEIPDKKSDAFSYESGYQSITRRSFSLGWRVFTITKELEYFELGPWDAPSTFRVSKIDPIVSDHESRRFHRLTKQEQRIMTVLTHGTANLN